MNAGATTERIYAALRARLLAGSVIPGEKLEPAKLADELNSSVTPVRDALHQLSGERIVEARASEGFHLPHVTEPLLRDRYRWHAASLRAAVRLWRQPTGEPSADRLPADVDRATPAFFALFAKRADNEEAVAQIADLGSRLTAARRAENGLVAGRETELRALAIAFDHETPAVLLRQVDGYHRRRLAIVPELVRALYRPR